MTICLALARSSPRAKCVGTSCGLGIEEVCGALDHPFLSCQRLISRKDKPERSTTLPYVLWDCFKRPLAVAIPPRLFLIIFRYSQAVLINIAVRYISNAPKESGSAGDGRWLIVAALVEYAGLAVSIEFPSIFRESLLMLDFRYPKLFINIIQIDSK
jgi:hypothetical protein